MYQKPDQVFIDYAEYRWTSPDQRFRGPEPDLSRPFIACLGGGHTFGRYVERPFPDLLAALLGAQVANFGVPGGGPGFFLRHHRLIETASRARLCIVQAMSAQSLSNRLYRVRPDTNTQIEAISKTLEALFPHVDFETFTYAHNMLNQIADADPDRFALVAAELREAWVARMRSLLQSIRTKRILLWFSERSPDEGRGEVALNYPQFVDREMFDAVAPLADRVVICAGAAGMPQSLLRNGEAVLQTPFGVPIRENRYYPSPEMHEAAAAALAAPARDLLDSDAPGLFAAPGSVVS